MVSNVVFQNAAFECSVVIHSLLMFFSEFVISGQILAYERFAFRSPKVNVHYVVNFLYTSLFGKMEQCMSEYILGF